ncbi:MAG: hypothetical protein JXB07_04665 [Anaerolineae bacterium]|nr:hypothetical protein [Anaerolineae bacterium]
MNSVTLIDEQLLVMHGALGSVYPGAWSQVLVKHFGGSEHSWHLALTTVYPYWDAPSAQGKDRAIVSSDLEQWHATRGRIVENWFKRAKHDQPSLQEVTISSDALKSLEREVGRLCKQSINDFRLKVMQRLARRNQHFAIISLDTPAELIRGLLDRHDADFQVIGPEELGQVGLDGVTWEALTNLSSADPATSRFLTTMEIEGWPVIHPWYDFAWKLFLDFNQAYEFTVKEKHSIDPAASEQAHHRLTAFTGQDFGSDIKAWTKWLRATWRRSKRQWFTLLRDGVQ